MRREDRDHLSQPYPPDARGDSRLAVALGVDLPSVRALHREILSDFDATRLGIGWWAPEPGRSRRILISDQLFLCAMSIEANIQEARFHLLEAKGAAEERDRAMVGSASNVRGRPQFVVPTPASPLVELIDVAFAANVVGSVRALASAFDCLGCTAIGVLGLKTDILKGGLKYAAQAAVPARASPFQSERWARIEEAFKRAGPPGWSDWVLDYRNTLVHRGRRTWLNRVNVHRNPILTTDGRAIFPCSIATLLPGDPARSEIEVMRESSHAEGGMLLTEDAIDTLEGAIESSCAAIRDSASLLLDAWRERRASPPLVKQPREQWPNVNPTPNPFVGYRPGTQPFDPTEIRANPTFVIRLQAASLEDRARAQWSTFD